MLKKSKRDAVERQFVRETATRQTEEGLEHAATTALSEWITAAASSARLVRVELTFKLRVQTPFGKRMRQPARAPIVHSARMRTAAVPTWKIAAIDDRRVLNVRVRKATTRLSLKTASLFATATSLPANEPIKAAVRVVNFLNRHFFKGKSRRSTNPEKFTVLACLHDLNAAGERCRPHLHVLFALPATLNIADFTALLRRAVTAETFINRRLMVEPVHDLARSVFYNADPNKHSERSPVIIVHPHSSTDHKEPIR